MTAPINADSDPQHDDPQRGHNPPHSHNPPRSDNPAPDAVPGDGRDETESERLDRNWTEILQELRVTQTGTQILTGFLLTLAFQPRFADLTPFQVDVYLVLVVLAALTTALGLAPVSLHRALFRQRAKHRIVAIADVTLKVTLVGVALVLSGSILLIFDVVLGTLPAVVTTAIVLLIIVAVWFAVPALAHPRRDERDDTLGS